MFDWDEANVAHVAKHGVTPQEVEEALTIAPVDVVNQQYEEEERFLQLGITSGMRILVVITTWRGDLLRVVTAYPATEALREYYVKERREFDGD